MASVNVKIPYLERKGRAFRYRRIVPRDVREAIGRKVWIKTFRSAAPLAHIEHTCARLADEHDLLITRARSGEIIDREVIARGESVATNLRDASEKEVLQWKDLWWNPRFEEGDPDVWARAFFNAVDNGGRYVPETITLAAAYQRDKKVHGGGREEKPIEYAVNSFIAHIGDRSIKAITRNDVQSWLSTMERKDLLPSTIKRRLGALRALTNRTLLDFDYDLRNPFAKHRIKGGHGRTDDRLPFNREMIRRMDAYLASNKRLGHDTRNILWIMKCSGAGPSEIGGLALGDIRLEDDIPFIFIRANKLRGLKTLARKRRIPLVAEALTAAEDAAARARRRAGRKSHDDQLVFSSFSADGRGADLISAKLNKAIRAAGVPKSPRLVAYSFRHSMKEALRSAAVPDHVQRRIMGHSGHGVADRYGSPLGRLSEDRDALVKAMQFLGDVDASIYRAGERV